MIFFFSKKYFNRKFPISKYLSSTFSKNDFIFFLFFYLVSRKDFVLMGKFLIWTCICFSHGIFTSNLSSYKKSFTLGRLYLRLDHMPLTCNSCSTLFILFYFILFLKKNTMYMSKTLSKRSKVEGGAWASLRVRPWAREVMWSVDHKLLWSMVGIPSQNCLPHGAW